MTVNDSGASGPNAALRHPQTGHLKAGSSGPGFIAGCDFPFWQAQRPALREEMERASYSWLEWFREATGRTTPWTSLVFVT
jgi:hypothetical protein